MRAFLLSICLSCCALAESPDIEIPPELTPDNDYVVFTPKTNAKAISYIGLSGVQPFPLASIFPGQKSLAFVLPVRGLAEGRYKFIAVGSLDDSHTQKPFTVVVGKPKDDDKVDPKPTPNPTNKPVKFVVIIEETADARGKRGVFLASRELAEYMSAKGIKHRVVDKDGKSASGQSPRDVQQFIDDSKGKALPRLYLVDGEGRMVAPVQTLPANVKDFIALLKQYEGK